MLIKQTNNLTQGAAKSYLTAQGTSGSTVFPLANSSLFTASWAVQFGETGEETTEIKNLSSDTPGGTLGTLSSALTFNHPTNTPIYAIKYDQIVFEVSTAGTAGTATPIASGTINIAPDSPFTQFDHTSGSLSNAYKTYWRSSALTIDSLESDWIVGTVPMYALGGIVERTKSKLWNAGFVVDEEVKDWANEWNEKLNNLLIQSNEDYNLGSTSVAFSGTAELGTITTEDFKQIRRVWFSSDGVNHYQASKMDINQFLPDQTFSETNPYFYMYGNNVIGRKPSDTTGTAGVIYYKLTDKLDDDYDLLPSPLRGYTKSYVDYCLIQAQYKDGKVSLSDKLQMEKALEDGFRAQITPRNKTGSTYVDIVDVETGNDNIY